MKRIMWCSDSPFLPTGYSNQSNYIVPQLIKSFGVCYYSHQYSGNEEMRNGYMHIPAAQCYPGDAPYGQNRIDFYVNKYNPDIVAWLCDAFMIPWTADRKTPPCPNCADDNKKNSYKLWKDRKTLMYFPFDSEEIYEGAKRTLENMTYRVAMSKFGQKLLKKETGLDSYYIPHCVDTNVFYPLSQEEKLKLKKGYKMEDKFVVGMVGRNQSRKSPSRLLYIFEEFARDKKDAVLFMHCDPNDIQGNQLVQIAKTLGISDKVIFTGVTWFSGYPMNVLNNIYNSFDVHCLTTTGEGFGITTLEAMSCGIPNIVTHYTTTKELLVEDGQCGEPVKWNTFLSGGTNTRRVLPDEQTFIKSLNKLYDSPDLRQQYGEVGRNKALKYYSTLNVLPQWTKLFSDILEA